ncbi:SdpI family protein [Maribacter sp. 2307ULW6-5]|uniref:SdpI family protein n=1 Tax=Maribacter sp. 2307ULW6-5 TaxID=3386275 RepID=UPI0039BCA9A4
MLYLIMVWNDFSFLGALFLLLVSFCYLVFPPKGINPVYGYRTPQSTKNEENWQWANRWGARSLLGISLVLCGVTYLNQEMRFMASDHLFLGTFLGGVGIAMAIIELRLWQMGKKRRETEKE